MLAVWVVVYFSLKNRESRKEMLLVSLWTSLFGLTEPLFVPEYWSPPSLFDLALRTGFDLESVLWVFGVSGLAVVIYEWVFKTRHKEISYKEKHLVRHKYHIWAILSTPIILFFLFFFSSFNIIYSVSISFVAGGLATWYCRPDLKKKMFASALIFLFLYFISFLILIFLSPGYVEQVWNLKAISGILVFGVPLEELIFAFSFGFLWSSIYEHFKWYKIKITANL